MELKTDLIVMTNVPHVQAIFCGLANDGVDPASGDTVVTWQNRLSMIFTAFTSKDFYAQVRLLDATGQETVLIDYDGSQAVRKFDSDLQNKSTSGYFTEAAALASGEVYLSALNLNRENGQVQVRHNPVVDAHLQPRGRVRGRDRHERVRQRLRGSHCYRSCWC